MAESSIDSKTPIDFFDAVNFASLLDGGGLSATSNSNIELDPALVSWVNGPIEEEESGNRILEEYEYIEEDDSVLNIKTPLMVQNDSQTDENAIYADMFYSDDYDVEVVERTNSEDSQETEPVQEIRAKPLCREHARDKALKRVLQMIRMKKTSRKNGGVRRTDQDIKVVFGDFTTIITIPMANDITMDELNRLVALRNRCLSELMILMKIVDGKTVKIEDFKKVLLQKVIPIAKNVTNPKQRKMIIIKTQIVGLVCKISEYQLKLAAMIEEIPTLLTLEDHDLLHIKRNNLERRPAWQSVPAIIPTDDDVNPGLKDFRQLVHLRDYCFQSVSTSLVSQVNLALSLNVDEMCTVFSNPIPYLVDAIRYIQLSTCQLFELFFKTDSQGKSVNMGRCPCGRQLLVAGKNITPHTGYCVFKEFIIEHIPSLMTGGYYCLPDRDIITPEYRKYLDKILKSRLPHYHWRTLSNGTQQLVRTQTGQDLRVVDQSPLSASELHERSCAARSSCWKCIERDTARNARHY